MAAESRMEKQARMILAREGGTIGRPCRTGGVFDVAYVRTGPRGEVPVVVIPGGPGLASVVPYAGFRTQAARAGLDVIMVEHRGVGLSGRRRGGEPLSVEEVTVEAAADDVAAVLDEIGVPQAIIAGSSYGTYLAQAVAVAHPERVAALVLESPMLSPTEDLAMVRGFRRGLLWEGTADTARLAGLVRSVAAAGEPMADLSMVVQVVYEFAGPEVLERLLQARLTGRLGPLWKWLARLGVREMDGPGVPYYMEPALVAGIGFGQLGYGLAPDGGPLDPQLTFAQVAADKPQFWGAPFDLSRQAPRYGVPVVVVSGERDLRTPRPVAQRIVDLVGTQATLIPLPGTGHSILDTHRLALIEIIKATRDQQVDRLVQAPQYLAALPRKGTSRLLGNLVTIMVRATTRPAH